MSRGWKVLGAGAAVLVLAGSGAVAQADGTGNHDEGGQTLRFRAVSVDFAEVDLGAPGFSLGDQLVFSDDLRRDGETVGIGGGACTIVRVTGDPAFQCLVTFRLPDGSIATQALVRGSELPMIRFAITGGTGAYDEAAGQGRASQDDRERIVFRLED